MCPHAMDEETDFVFSYSLYTKRIQPAPGVLRQQVKQNHPCRTTSATFLQADTTLTDAREQAKTVSSDLLDASRRDASGYHVSSQFQRHATSMRKTTSFH